MARFIKGLFFFILFILILFIGMIGFAPTILSTNYGREKVTEWINSTIDGSITIKKANLNWFGKQSLEGIVLKDPYGETIFTLDTLSISESLFQLSQNMIRLKELKIDNFNAVISRYENGFTNLQMALTKKHSPSIHLQHPALSSQLLLQDVHGLATYHTKDKKFSFNLKGNTQQDDLNGQFNITGVLLSDNPDLLAEMNDLTLNVNIINFPVEIIDEIVSLSQPQIKGLITKALGKYLNASIVESQTQASAITEWNMTSPNLHLSFSGLIEPHQLTLTTPAKLDLIVTPQFFSALLKNSSFSKLTLQKPTKSTLWIQNLSLPYDSKTFHINPQNLGINLEFAIDSMAINNDHENPIFIDAMTAELSSSKASNSIKLQADAHAKKANKDNSSFKLAISTEKPKSFTAFSLTDHTTVKVKTVNFPAKSLKNFLKLTSLPIDLLGNQVSLLFDGRYENQKGLAEIEVSSENIVIPKTTLTLNETLSIKDPLTVNCTVDKQIINSLLKIPSVYLTTDLPIKLNINNLQYSLTPSKKNYIDIDAVSNQNIEINIENKNLILNQATAKIFSNTNDLLQCQLQAYVPPAQNSDLISALLSNTTVEVKADFDIQNEFSLKLTKILTELKGETTSAQIALNAEENAYELASPATIQSVLLPRYFNHFLLNKLKDPIPFSLTIATLDKKFTLHDLHSLNLAGHLSIPKIVLDTSPNHLQLTDLLIPLEIHGLENKFRVDFSGKTLNGSNNDDGSFQGKYTAKDWISNENTIIPPSEHKLNLDLVNFPTNFLSLVNKQNNFSKLIGPVVNSEILLYYLPESKQGTLDIHLDGQDFKFGGSLINKDSALTILHDPISLTYVLTPERFDALKALIPLNEATLINLTSNATLNATIDTLNLLHRNNSLLLGDSAISMKLSLDHLNLYNTQNNQDRSIDKLEFFINSKKLSKDVDVSTLLESKYAGTWDIDAKVKNFLDANQSMNFKTLTLDLIANIHQLDLNFPSIFSNKKFKYLNKMQALFGDTLDANITSKIHEMNGSIQTHFVGPNATLNLDAALNEGILRLNTPSTATLKATPELSQEIFSELVPFLADLQDSDQPIRISVDPSGFSIPFLNFNKKDIQTGQCLIDFGKMNFKNSGQMKLILAFLQKKLPNNIPIWLTPIYFKITNGIAAIQRFDMFIDDTYPLAAWGNINLVKEKVNMIVGITGRALIAAFNLEKLDPNFMLQIPYKGSLNNPKLDKKKATGRISSIIAHEQGNEGKMVGTLLDFFSGASLEQKVPPPTTNPLPWEHLLQEKK